MACVGVRPSDDGPELRSVATLTDFRRQGLASRLIAEVVRLLDLGVVWAETDDDAVGFFRAIGFEVISLGERYPGVVRYRCTSRRLPG